MNRFIEPTKFGLQYDDKKQRLSLFHDDAIYIIRLNKPFPAAFIKTKEEPFWKNYIPNGRFPFLLSKPLKKEINSIDPRLKKYYKYRNKVYSKIVYRYGKETIKFINQYRDRSWFIMSLIFHCERYGANFVKDNPAIAYLLASHAVFRKLKSRKYWRSNKSLIRKKRKKILGYFGFPESDITVKLFSKISPQICSIELFLWLRKALKENPKLLRRFSFFPKLNIGAISLLLSDNDNKMSYNLINEVAYKRKENEKPFTLFKIKDIYRMQKTLVDNDINRRILKLNKLSEIHILHDEMVYLINDLEIIVNYEYPKCKIADIKKNHIWIEIIPNSKSLHREGYEMSHCIFSYDDDIKENSYYAARMLKPERVTILFKENIYGYQIIDIHGKHNSDSRKNSEDLIKKWLIGKVHFPDESLQLRLFDDLIEGEIKLVGVN